MLMSCLQWLKPQSARTSRCEMRAFSIHQRGIFGFAPPVAKKFESGSLFCEWIAVLRVVRNSAMTEYVVKALEGVGALMAHDLRHRIIFAGLESKLASANSPR